MKRKYNLGERILELCDELELDIDEVCEKAGITISTVYSYTRDFTLPKYKTICNIAKAMSISVDRLLDMGIRVSGEDENYRLFEMYIEGWNKEVEDGEDY